MSVESLEVIAEVLAAGGGVAVPTDTVYGLAVDPSRQGATSRVFLLKRRPDALALPVLVASLTQALALAEPAVERELRALAAAFWPGALTIVVPRRAGVALDIGGDSMTVGVRCPARSEPRELCQLVGPLAVTSANIHGFAPCTSVEELHSSFGSELAVLDGGRCAGVPSTVVALRDGRIEPLRRGPVAVSDITDVLATVDTAVIGRPHPEPPVG